MADDKTMPIKGEGIDRRRLLIGGAYAAAAAGAWAMLPSDAIDMLGDEKLDDVIPKNFGDWKFQTASGLVIPPEDSLSDAIYNDLLTRVYANSEGVGMMLLIAYSAKQTGVLQIHRPEFCYPAGGYLLSEPVRQVLPMAGKPVDTVMLTASSDARTEQMLYWTRVGRYMPNSWANQRLAVAKENLAGFVPDAALIRISTIDQDPSRALKAMSSFADDLVTALPPVGRNTIIA